LDKAALKPPLGVRHDIHRPDVHCLNERGKVADLASHAEFILIGPIRVCGHAIAEAVRGQHTKLIRESGDVEGPVVRT